MLIRTHLYQTQFLLQVTRRSSQSVYIVVNNLEKPGASQRKANENTILTVYDLPVIRTFTVCLEMRKISNL